MNMRQIHDKTKKESKSNIEDAAMSTPGVSNADEHSLGPLVEKTPLLGEPRGHRVHWQGAFIGGFLFTLLASCYGAWTANELLQQQMRGRNAVLKCHEVVSQIIRVRERVYVMERAKLLSVDEQSQARDLFRTELEKLDNLAGDVPQLNRNLKNLQLAAGSILSDSVLPAGAKLAHAPALSSIKPQSWKILSILNEMDSESARMVAVQFAQFEQLCRRNNIVISAMGGTAMTMIALCFILSVNLFNEFKRSGLTRNLIETSLDPLMAINTEGTITDVNGAAENVTGVMRENLIGTKFSAYFTDPEKALAGYELVLAEGKVTNYPLTIRHASGKQTSVLYNATVYRNQRGAIEGVIAAARDMASQLIPQHLAAIVETSTDAIISQKLDGTILTWNQGAQRLFGYSEAEIKGQNISLIIPSELLFERNRLVERVLRGEPAACIETERITKDGTRLHVTLSLALIKDSFGSVTAISAIVRDVSEQHRTAQELRAASVYARNLIEASPDPLVSISPQGKITDVNQATESVTGLPRHKLIGSAFSEFFTQPNEALAGYKKVLTEGFVKDYPLVIKHVSGRLTHVLYNASIYRNANGEPEGIFAVARDVTERKRMEDELRNTSQYVRSLIEASLDPLVTISPAGKITDMNNACELATGLGREALIGTDFSDYFTEPARARAGYQQALAGGFVRDYPLSIKHSAGFITEVMWNAKIYKNDQGELIGVFAAARDITEQRRAEQQIRNLANIVESSNEAIISKTVDGKILTWNRGAEAVYGYTEQEVLGKPITLVLPSDDSDHLPELLNKVTRGEYIRGYHTKRMTKSGRYIYVSLNLSPMRDAGGNITGIASIATDVSEQRAADEKNRTPLQILEEAPDFVSTAALDEQVLYLNKCFRDAVGITNDQDLAMKKIADLQPDWAYRLIKEQGIPCALRDGLWLGESAIKAFDGSEIPVWLAIIPHRTPEGVIDVISTIGRNITEQKRIEKERQEINAELERRVTERTTQLQLANKELTDFSYSVAHNLRTPLRGISGFSQIILDDYGDQLPGSGKDALCRIVAASKRMGEVIDDILSLCKVGRSSLNLTEVNITALARVIKDDLEHSDMSRQAEFSIEEGMICRGDEHFLRILLNNLMENSWKFSIKHSKVHISVGSFDRAGETVYFVRDDGAGFDMSFANKLFRPFERLHTNFEFEGNGIGLAIARAIIDHHGGRIWAEGEVEKGATVYFSLGQTGTETKPANQDQLTMVTGAPLYLSSPSSQVRELISPSTQTGKQ